MENPQNGIYRVWSLGFTRGEKTFEERENKSRRSYCGGRSVDGSDLGTQFELRQKGKQTVYIN